MTEFKKRTERVRMAQKFDREKIFIEKCGKKINVYDAIQAANEDCEIYEVLEKYGCIDRIKRDDEAMYADVTQLQSLGDLRGVMEQKKMAEQMFYNLPLEVRREYDNDLNKFTTEAPKRMEAWQKAKKAEELRKTEELKKLEKMKGNENVEK